MPTISPETAINFTHLRQYVGDDLALTAEVFGMFKHQVDMWGKMLSADATDEMWSSVTHSLKGSARAVGACGLADCCEQAEGLTGAAATSTARIVAVQDICQWIDAVTHRISRWEYRQTMSGLRQPI